MEPQLALVVMIIFAGGLTRATFGFGEALVAMPLLSMVVDVRVAAALIAMTSIFNALAILSTDWQSVERQAAGRLILAAWIGIPLGVYGLVYVSEAAVKLVLALVVVGFASYNLIRPRLCRLENDSLGVVFGLISGVLGGAYNTLGPPLVIFGTLRGWDPSTFRATLQAVFLPTSLFVCLNHYLYGLWTGEVFRCLLFSLPALLLAAALGKWLNSRIESQRFSRYMFCLLLAVGGMLVVSVLARTAAAGS